MSTATAVDEAVGTWPWRVERRWSNGCEVCPEIWLGQQWVATVTGAPHLGHDSVAVAERIVAALNALKEYTTDEIRSGAWRRGE